MFLLSFRLTKKKIAVVAVAAVAAVGLGTLGVRSLAGGGSAVPTAQGGETAARVEPRKVKAKSNEERVAFAQSFGWEIDPAPLEVMEVIIPEEFDEVYMEYNGIQIEQGFDLEKQAGKRVKRYTYAITNYPGAEDEVRFNLLAIGDKIIGGDVSSRNAGGFMHGFELAE
jgi:hypothetical protein